MIPSLLPNLSPSPIDIRDRIASLPEVTLLPCVDLKPFVTEVEDQGAFSSCTANAGCSALELMYNKHHISNDFSRMYLYYYTRELSGISGDHGAWPRDIGKALRNYGICSEKTWAYEVTNITTVPSDIAIAEAAPNKILSYEQLTGDKLSQIKNALSQEIPVLLTIAIHRGFYYLFGSWKTHTWDYDTSEANPILGYHQLLIIGYDDDAKRLLVENSWSSSWADGGFFGLPYEMITSPSFGELWVLMPDIKVSVDPIVPTPVDPIVPTPGTPVPLIVKLTIVAMILGALITFLY